jgi:hypothetical protein
LGAHSWDGGLSPTSVFWALSIPNGSAQVNLDAGTASLHIENLCVFDAFIVPNSIAGVNRSVNLVKGIINSVQIDWSGIISVDTANQPDNQMRGKFVENIAKISVTATTPKTAITSLSNGHGFQFASDPASTSVSNFAQIGFEQNGVFY